MKFLRRTDWRTLSLELVIVFVGLLAALQVDEWREERGYRAAEARNLQRLGDDLDSSIASSRDMLEMLQEHFEGVRHVSESFDAGKIVNNDTALFEVGLIYVGHLPALPIQRTAYDEMVASGMFARLQSEELKRTVSKLYATKNFVDQNFSWWRNDISRLQTRMLPRVRYYSEGELLSSNMHVINEPLRRIEFDFDELQQDIQLRNEFYWAADIHSDWVAWTRVLITLAEKSRAELNNTMLSP